MNRIKVIKTEGEYQEALRRIDALMDAPSGSAEEEELELLALLADKYEREHFPIELPDPIEAILFRMEQQDLTAKDMEQYLGSQSKVSEVLNRKRPLSLSMIRNLHEGLEIPLEVLIQKPTLPEDQPDTPAWDKLIHKQIRLNCAVQENKKLLDGLEHWQNTLLKLSDQQKLPAFRWDRLDEALFKELAALSIYSAGPQMAVELLNQHGIHLVVLKIEPLCELDGACFLSPSRRPVIGLTLRSNQLENFWFILFHLLAHLHLHRSKAPVACFESIPYILDPDAPEEETLVNEFLRHALAPPAGSKQKIKACIARGDREGLHQAIQASRLSPEVLACWARLDENVANLPIAPRKISEKLEVYG